MNEMQTQPGTNPHEQQPPAASMAHLGGAPVSTPVSASGAAGGQDRAVKTDASQAKQNPGDQDNRETHFREDLSAFVDDVEELLSRGTTLSADAMLVLKNRLGMRVGTTREHLNEMTETSKARAYQLFDTCEGYVRAEPLKSLGIAIALGATVGYLMHTRGDG